MTAPLTDEELAAIQGDLDRYSRPPTRADCRRLIADLRAERAGSNALWRRNNELQAEVERLQARIERLKRVSDRWAKP